MQNDTEKTLTEKEFKKAWEELEAEYEMELQKIHAEIEQEKKQTAEKNQVK